MKIIDWVKDFFVGGQNTITLTQKMNEQTNQLAIETFAMATGMSIIASAISKCEFKTFNENNEVKSDDYYLWNIEPNKNQNSSQFMQELITRLLYYNECLIVDINGQLIIADNFTQNEFVCVENTFTDISRGDFTFSSAFKMSEVLYFKLDHINTSVLLSNLVRGYDNLLKMSIGKYKRSGGRKVILKVDKTASGDKDFKAKIDDLFNNQFKNYFEAENAVIHLPNGMDYDEQQAEGGKKSTSEIMDVFSLTREIFDRTAQALKIPPALLRGDIANVENATDNLLTFCIDPICDMLQEEIIRKRYGKNGYSKGFYLKIDTTRIKHIDTFSVAEKVDKLISSGIYNIDELRVKMGDIALNEDWSKKHYITKNYQDIDGLKGGEINNGKN